MGCSGTIGRAGLYRFHFFHNLIAHCHLAENRVAHIEPRSGYGGDEELTSICRRSAIGHCEKAGLVEFNRCDAFVGKRLIPDRLPSGSSSCRVTALNHEILDDPVKK